MRRRKAATKCLLQLFTSTMNQKHKTTALWLTGELCTFTVHYWESFSHRQCHLQTDRWTHTHARAHTDIPLGLEGKSPGFAYLPFSLFIHF